MTALIPDYETEGPLTLCPCCGGQARADYGHIFACGKCWVWSQTAQARDRSDVENVGSGRLEWARIGLDLRAAGKLPPLTCRTREIETGEATRWGVYYDSGHFRGWYSRDGVPWTSNERVAVEMHADWLRNHQTPSDTTLYTVRPYPSGEKTSEAGRAAAGTPADFRRESHPETETAPRPPTSEPWTTARMADGGAAKVTRDVYREHRETREKRHAELVAERAKLVSRLAEVDRELGVTEKGKEVR